MKPGFILTTVIVLLATTKTFSQQAGKESNLSDVSLMDGAKSKTKKRMNFFIISKPKKLLDPPTRFNILRAKFKSMLHPKKFSCIVAGSADDMSKKVEYRLRKEGAVIGSLWFDSHG